MLEDMRERMPDRMPEDMPHRLAESVPEDMQDRTSEGSLPVKCTRTYERSFMLSFLSVLYAKMVLLRFGSAATDQPCFCTR